MDSDCTGGRTAMQFDTASQNNFLMGITIIIPVYNVAPYIKD